MLKQWIVLFLTTAFMLAACHHPVYNQTQGNVADVKLRQEAARKKQDTDARTSLPLIVKQGPYVDMSPISIHGQPSWLRNHIVIRGDQLPFSYYSRTIANGASKTILTKYQVGLFTNTVSMSYSRPIKGTDILASKTGYVYSIVGASVYWQAL